ncbi:MAG: hypothetical protein E7340_01685 [Clostridiales bacterium]|nr:hypothetical protein [Clostridiales bacterium]
MKTLLPTIMDTAFTAFITFLLVFILLSFAISRPFAFVFSITIASLVALIVFKILKNRKARVLLSKAESDACEIMCAQLNLYTQKEQIDFFYSVFKSNGIEVEKKNNYLYFAKKHIVLYPKFSFDNVSKTDIVRVFNYLGKADNAYILSEKFSGDINDFISRFGGRIESVYPEKVYKYLAEKESLPKEKYPFNKKQKLNLSAFRVLISKKKAKTNLGFGLIFLIMSYFVPIKIYYIIIGAIFLILALFCRLFGLEEANTQNA